MCCDTGKRWHGTGFILIHAIFVNGKEFIMGYFSEMSLDMQEGRKPSAASLTDVYKRQRQDTVGYAFPWGIGKHHLTEFGTA